MTRPTWTDYLLGMAKCASRRSADSQTKHGCIITGPDHKILSTGYNSFPRGMRNDALLPNTRPAKYPWMLHAEENAVCNASAPLVGGTAYITGSSCFRCMKLLWQAGVQHIVQVDGYGWMLDSEEADLKAEFTAQSGIQIDAVVPDLSWLVDLVLEDPSLRELVISRLATKTERQEGRETQHVDHKEDG